MAKNLAKQAAKELLREAVAKFPGSIAALAKKAGVSPSTITRPLNDEEYGYVPKQATLDKIARAAGLDTAPQEIGRIHAAAQVANIPILGAVKAGVWLDEPDAHESEFVALPINTPRHLSAFTLDQAGGGFGYREGTILVVEEGSPIFDGCEVVIRRFKGDVAETTLRVVEIEDGVTKLWSPPRAEGRDLECVVDDGSEEITYMGGVIASFWSSAGR